MTASLLPVLRQRFVDKTTGEPLAYGRLYSYEVGTTTPKVTYSDFNGTENNNPVDLDQYGEADVWIFGNYKFVLKNAAGVEQYTIDNVQDWLSAVRTNNDPWGSYTHIQNLGLSFSVAGGALICLLQQRDGVSDPDENNPVIVSFPPYPLTTGSFNVRTVTAEKSMVISSGSTMGHISGAASTLYWYLIDNGGSVEMAVSSRFYGTQGVFSSTTAEGGAGGADSFSTIYTMEARSNVPFLLIAKTVDTQVTAGTWAATPSEVRLYPFENKWGIKGSNVASATTINLSSATGDYVHITGTTTIATIRLNVGEERTVVFDGVLTLTNSSSLILWGSDIVTAAGDVAIFRGDATTGEVRLVSYQRGVGPGQFIESNVAVGSAVSLTTGTTANVTTITLSPGDWDVEGVVAFTANAATTGSYFVGSISQTSATNPTVPGGGAFHQLAIAVGAGSAMPVLPTGRVRMSVTTNTTVYLVATAVFAVNTMGAYGYISARRWK